MPHPAAPESTISRRRLAVVATGSIAALGLAPTLANAAQGNAPKASPAASPVASTNPAPTTAEVLPPYQELADAVRTLGRSLVEPLLEGNSAPLKAALPVDGTSALEKVDVDALVAALQRDQVRFSFAEVGAYFAGNVSAGKISGYFQQGGARDRFTLTPVTTANAGAGTPEATPIASSFPTGAWSGQLDTLKLPLDVTFAGTAESPTATLTIASQGITNLPLSDVAFYPTAPIGEMTAERAIPLDPTAHIYSQVRDWADSSLQIDLSITDETVTSIDFQPTVILPPDPAAAHVSTVTYRLPWEQGAWFVFWGGDTEFQNYHAVAPGQRHALDIVIWQDGGTHTGDGAGVEDYFIFGQSLVAPAAGTVVEVFNNEPEQTPGAPLSQTNPEAFKTLHPAGNHAVIQTADDEFVYMAHMQTGSVRVRVGDHVEPGDAIGLVGNSGNTSEPHLHIHIQNVADFYSPSAVGIPLAFSNLTIDGEPAQDTPLVQGTFAEPIAG